LLNGLNNSAISNATILLLYDSADGITFISYKYASKHLITELLLLPWVIILDYGIEYINMSNIGLLTEPGFKGCLLNS
jgi:hypothetical protein